MMAYILSFYLNPYHDGYFYVLHSPYFISKCMKLDGFQLLASIYEQGGKQRRLRSQQIKIIYTDFKNRVHFLIPV